MYLLKKVYIKMKNISEESNIKICIIMLGLFGDVLLRTPILRSIKNKYPNSVITVVVDKIGYDILYNNPNIDYLIILNRAKKNIFKYIYSKIISQIKIIFSRFDLIIDLYNGNSSKNMLRLSFSKFTIGGKKYFEHYSFKNNFHLTNQLFQTLYDLDLEKNSMSVQPDFFINKTIEQDLLNSAKYLFNKNHYLISLGSGDLKKIIDMSKTFEIVKYLNDVHNLTPLIVLNLGQEFLQENLINDFLIPNKISYIKLDKKSIDEIAVIIKYVKFFIVPDTGLFHLSLALKTPTFCIFTYTLPNLVEPEDCSIIYKSCYKIIHDKDGLQKCTKEIDVSHLIKDLDEFLDEFSDLKKDY